jgi:8-oxo-dGTP pyrophosphatase MutT (NUDIX family)
MDDELIDIIDNRGNFVKIAKKSEAHKHGWLHKTVIGGLKYGDDWALVRQAPDRQDAGQLVSPVGGHVKAGETVIEGLLRESDEEIGTREFKYKHVGTAVFRRNIIGRDENHMFILYEITTPDKIILGNEAIAIERFTPKELKDELAKKPERFGDAFYFILEKFYHDYLPKTWVNKWD